MVCGTIRYPYSMRMLKHGDTVRARLEACFVRMRIKRFRNVAIEIFHLVLLHNTSKL